MPFLHTTTTTTTTTTAQVPDSIVNDSITTTIAPKNHTVPNISPTSNTTNTNVVTHTASMGVRSTSHTIHPTPFNTITPTTPYTIHPTTSYTIHPTTSNTIHPTSIHGLPTRLAPIHPQPLIDTQVSKATMTVSECPICHRTEQELLEYVKSLHSAEKEALRSEKIQLDRLVMEFEDRVKAMIEKENEFEKKRITLEHEKTLLDKDKGHFDQSKSQFEKEKSQFDMYHFAISKGTTEKTITTTEQIPNNIHEPITVNRTIGDNTQTNISSTSCQNNQVMAIKHHCVVEQQQQSNNTNNSSPRDQIFIENTNNSLKSPPDQIITENTNNLSQHNQTIGGDKRISSTLFDNIEVESTPSSHIAQIKSKIAPSSPSTSSSQIGSLMIPQHQYTIPPSLHQNQDIQSLQGQNQLEYNTSRSVAIKQAFDYNRSQWIKLSKQSSMDQNGNIMRQESNDTINNQAPSLPVAFICYNFININKKLIKASTVSDEIIMPFVNTNTDNDPNNRRGSINFINTEHWFKNEYDQGIFPSRRQKFKLFVRSNHVLNNDWVQILGPDKILSRDITFDSIFMCDPSKKESQWGVSDHNRCHLSPNECSRYHKKTDKNYPSRHSPYEAKSRFDFVIDVKWEIIK